MTYKKYLIINRKYIVKTKELRINEQIKAPEAMIIDDQGEQLGVMKIQDALALAELKELDLAEVSPNINPPVCKIIDYGKYLYKIAKQKRQHSSKQKKVEIKGIRISMRTEQHDTNFKAKNAVKFLAKGHKVKIDMVLKGREKAHINLASEKLENFLNTISEISKSNKETKDKEIIREQIPKKTPQGFFAIIEYKRKQ